MSACSFACSARSAIRSRSGLREQAPAPVSEAGHADAERQPPAAAPPRMELAEATEPWSRARRTELGPGSACVTWRRHPAGLSTCSRGPRWPPQSLDERDEPRVLPVTFAGSTWARSGARSTTGRSGRANPLACGGCGAARRPPCSWTSTTRTGRSWPGSSCAGATVIEADQVRPRSMPSPPATPHRSAARRAAAAARRRTHCLLAGVGRSRLDGLTPARPLAPRPQGRAAPRAPPPPPPAPRCRQSPRSRSRPRAGRSGVAPAAAKRARSSPASGRRPRVRLRGRQVDRTGNVPRHGVHGLDSRRGSARARGRRAGAPPRRVRSSSNRTVSPAGPRLPGSRRRAWLATARGSPPAASSRAARRSGPSPPGGRSGARAPTVARPRPRRPRRRRPRESRCRCRLAARPPRSRAPPAAGGARAPGSPARSLSRSRNEAPGMWPASQSGSPAPGSPST